MVGDPDEYFREYRRQLSQLHLDSIVADIHGSLDGQLGRIVREISVFRRLTGSTIEAMFGQQLIPEDIQSADVLGQMQNAHLLIGPSRKEPFYRDHLIRRVLALDLLYGSKEEDQARYRQINGFAIMLYKDWIEISCPLRCSNPPNGYWR